jgi:hypothetical protein
MSASLVQTGVQIGDFARVCVYCDSKCFLPVMLFYESDEFAHKEKAVRGENAPTAGSCVIDAAVYRMACAVGGRRSTRLPRTLRRQSPATS